jgi:uncharacterized protein involved in type VI secretion and phage assembly
MPGLVEALVVDNVDPEKLGRVRVKFPTLPDAPESFWARLVMPMAGRERGWMTIPEIDDEVLVSFVNGSHDDAIVMGSLYNGVDTPPYANEDGENNLRVFQSRSGHRLTFDDTKGDERIELISHNEEIRIIWDAKAKVISVYSGKDIIVEAKETLSWKCKDFIVDASNSVSVKAGTTMELKAGSKATVDGGGSLVLTGGVTKLN